MARWSALLEDMKFVWVTHFKSKHMPLWMELGYRNRKQQLFIFLSRWGRYMRHQTKPSLIQIMACRLFWTNADTLSIRSLGITLSEIPMGIQILSFTNMHLKMSSAKWRPFCLDLNVLISFNCSWKARTTPWLSSMIEILSSVVVINWIMLTIVDGYGMYPVIKHVGYKWIGGLLL